MCLLLIKLVVLKVVINWLKKLQSQKLENGQNLDNYLSPKKCLNLKNYSKIGINLNLIL